MDAHTQDMHGEGESYRADEVAFHSDMLNEKGVNRAIKDGLEDDGKETLVEDEEIEKLEEDDLDDVTSDEERELPGQKRPPRGSGWWGIGRPLQPHRKGVNKDFADGAGLPSPGRWKIRDRKLPESDVAEDLRDTLAEALKDMEHLLPGGSAKATLAKLMAGGLTESPFPAREMDIIRGIVRDVLEEHGFDRGEKRNGDAEQITETRLTLLYLRPLAIPTTTSRTGGRRACGWVLQRDPCQEHQRPSTGRFDGPSKTTAVLCMASGGPITRP